ncbi:MAG: EFR1 family ferrodoxin [Muribaculaceae bacterium]|nr:EFR1 family ferrodoxin [Muribaculaceae bacterium]
MIYYFSGTGNSRAAAKSIGERLGEQIGLISQINPNEEVFRGEMLGFIFPVYAWGVPPLVLNFISHFSQEFIDVIKDKSIPVWVVMTCGDEVALAPEMIQRTCDIKGIKIKSIWSVIMPNDYVLLPGFDVDSREVEKEKLDKAPARISEIVTGLCEGKEGVFVVRGSMAWIKTKLVYPLFKRWGVFPKKWHHTDACVGCGICVKNCPLKNIRLSDSGFPLWGENCCSCVACYHSCPRHAVEYGKATKGKGQYMYPEIRKGSVK